MVAMETLKPVNTTHPIWPIENRHPINLLLTNQHSGHKYFQKQNLPDIKQSEIWIESNNQSEYTIQTDELYQSEWRQDTFDITSFKPITNWRWLSVAMVAAVLLGPTAVLTCLILGGNVKVTTKYIKHISQKKAMLSSTNQNVCYKSSSVISC